MTNMIILTKHFNARDSFGYQSAQSITVLKF